MRFVSIVMPIRNEADFIAISLGAILRQDYPHEYLEIIIADGMSEDKSRAIIEALATESSIPIRIVDNPKQIAPSGLNIAQSAAKGEIIIRVDGHCEIAPNYVSEAVKELENDDIAGVGGAIETMSSAGVGQSIALAMSSKFGVGGSAFRTTQGQRLYVDTIPFPAYWREAMEKAGAYDESLMRNQDDEYNFRLRSLGYKLLLSPNLRSKYTSRSSLQKLWRQYFQYGFYKVAVIKKHPKQASLRHFIPFTFVLFLCFGWLILPVWFLGLALYCLLNFAFSFRLAAESGWEHLPRLPLIFFCLHLAYGLGFALGILRSLRP